MRIPALLLSICIAAGFFVSSAASAAAAPPLLVVESAWIRSPPPGTDVAAAYFTLRNPGTRAVVVVGIETPAAMHAMLHETRMEGGQTRMRMLDKIVVAPGHAVSLAPGSVHVMLHGMTRALTIGESVPLVLLLTGGEKLTASAVVRSASGE